MPRYFARCACAALRAVARRAPIAYYRLMARAQAQCEHPRGRVRSVTRYGTTIRSRQVRHGMAQLTSANATSRTTPRAAAAAPFFAVPSHMPRAHVTPPETPCSVDAAMSAQHCASLRAPAARRMTPYAMLITPDIRYMLTPRCCYVAAHAAMLDC